jgi:hypothetical protein
MVTGGGSGSGSSNTDVEVEDFERGLQIVRRVLRELRVAPSRVIIQRTPEQVIHKVYD